MGWSLERVKPPKEPPPCDCPLCREKADESDE